MFPTIAVVIPNRNDSGHLKKCLDSVLTQDVPPDQIIVVDDQSTDDSLEVIQKKLSNFADAKIVANPTCLGTMGALNEGLKCATSEYVLFLSSNDYVEKGIFERAKSGIATAGYPGVWSAMVWVVDENGRHLHLYPSPVVSLNDAFFPPDECIRLARTVGHWFTGTTLIYHRETLQKIGGFDIAYQGLGDLLGALTVASIKGAAFSPEPLGVMRQHEGGLYWRTLTNLPALDAILEKMESAGSRLSPALFTSQFCGVMVRRIRFSAIRAFNDNTWLPHSSLWQGFRYRLLRGACRLLGKYRKLQLALAFVLLRPPFDLIAIVWYRLLGRFMVMRRRKSTNRGIRTGGVL
jgi:hypothetical protein